MAVTKRSVERDEVRRNSRRPVSAPKRSTSNTPKRPKGESLLWLTDASHETKSALGFPLNKGKTDPGWGFLSNKAPKGALSSASVVTNGMAGALRADRERYGPKPASPVITNGMADTFRADREGRIRDNRTQSSLEDLINAYLSQAPSVQMPSKDNYLRPYAEAEAAARRVAQEAIPMIDSAHKDTLGLLAQRGQTFDRERALLADRMAAEARASAALRNGTIEPALASLQANGVSTSPIEAQARIQRVNDESNAALQREFLARREMAAAESRADAQRTSDKLREAQLFENQMALQAALNKINAGRADAEAQYLRDSAAAAAQAEQERRQRAKDIEDILKATGTTGRDRAEAAISDYIARHGAQSRAPRAFYELIKGAKTANEALSRLGEAINGGAFTTNEDGNILYGLDPQWFERMITLYFDPRLEPGPETLAALQGLTG